jgi:hypothetical protein
MTNFLSKTNLPNYCYTQLLVIAMTFVFGCYLTLETHHPVFAILSIMFLTCYSYFVHYLCHQLPDMINLHIKYHHLPQSSWWIQYSHLIIETLVNIGFFAVVYGIQHMIKLEVIPTVLIVFYGMIYVSVHIINYSLCHASPKHMIHHRTSGTQKVPFPPSVEDSTITPPSSTSHLQTKNYGPDCFDHFFGTNDDETFEDFNHMIPNILVSFFLTWYWSIPKSPPPPLQEVITSMDLVPNIKI